MLRAMSKTVHTIPAFVARCDAYCHATGRSRVWLSKRLFNETNRLARLAEDPSTDMGVRVMERVTAALASLEREASRAAAA